MTAFFGRLWIDATIAISFLREGRIQSLMITLGVAIGVAIIFITALIQGLQTNLIESTLGSQAHIRLVAPDEVNLIAPYADDTLQLIQEDKRPQRLRS